MNMSARDALGRLAERFWALQCDEFPMTAIQAGVSHDAEMLLREAPGDYERRAAWAKSAKLELMAIDVAGLDADDRATHALLERELNALIEIVECNAHLRPSLYPGGPEFELGYWAGATVLATVADARRYLERLASIPAALDGVRSALAQGVRRGIRYPAIVIERAIEQVRGQVSMPVDDNPFYQPFRRVAGRSESFRAVAAEGYAVVAGEIYPAFQAYADFIGTMLAGVARQSIACTNDLDGDAFYRFQIRQFTTIDLSPDEIHAIGLAEVERLNNEMLAVAAEAGCPDDLAEFRRRLQGDNRQFLESGEALREQIEILSKRIDAIIPEYFGRTPRTTYGIKSIPEAIAAKLPPAYAQPNPADGSAAGIHWITSIPAKCPRYMHLPLALHEAWPGHLMHLALIQEMEHLPDFRRFGASRYAACLEGWALYCEALGEEMGFYDTPEKIYGRLEMEMWRAVRLVVDTGIHVRGWSREKAIRYFGEYMAMPLETVAAEVDRYIAMPGQALAYQVGNLTFRKIRLRAEAALAENFRIRDFHDALMAAGPVTLPVLDDLMDAWVNAQEA
ncbi:DUF885 domain-containing protein [Sphingosinicella rhizophila]|uniref:DUF885 domain-containing protein n=1 Tax=Sphingosinicella rhizophila TaxID=3050082 RepID=A0ABU3Q5S3_9SPHN|nr:DUF885 domain-containing protein [Sphingosinicella sp. GR2756]MDT9598760.1 DUF885 domain-containing protein [Sphingosinicella sp. GR2756]